MPQPVSNSMRRPAALGPSLIYDPFRARNPISTQSEAPPTSTGLNRAWHSGQVNPRVFDKRTNQNNTGNRVGSFANAQKNAMPVNNGDLGLHNLGSAQSNRTEATLNALRKEEKIHTRDRFKIGVIFSTAHHVVDDELGPLPQDNFRTESNAGMIFSKYRKFTIVALYHHHCVAISLYAHEGKGLVQKPLDLEEFVSVWDKNPAAVASTKGDTRHGILWTRNRGYETGFAANHMCNAQLSHPFSHSFTKPCITELDTESVKKLTDLYLACMDRGLDVMLKELRIDDTPVVVDPRDHSNYDSSPKKKTIQKVVLEEGSPIRESWDM